MKMENKTTSLEDLFEKLKEYGDTRVKLFKLKSINKVSGFFFNPDIFSDTVFHFNIGTSLYYCSLSLINRRMAG